MATTADHGKKTVGEGSSTMRNEPKSRFLRSRFRAFVDSDNEDDTGGGVLLRDFEDDSLDSGGSTLTPLRTESSFSSRNVRATEPRKKAATVFDNKQTVPGRRNTIAPIGTGRYSEKTKNDNGGSGSGVALNETVTAWLNTKDFDNAAEKQQEPTGNTESFTSATSQTFGLTSNIYSQPTSAQKMSLSYITSPSTAVNINTPTPHHGSANIRSSQSANTLGYPWGNTPIMAYTSSGVAYNTPQASAYRAPQGTALGASFSSMNVNATPSHMHNNIGKNPMTTPQSASIYSSQYNQTEPRNFAPRAGELPTFMPPPPAFNLGSQSAVKSREHFQLRVPDSDPFMSPTSQSGTTFMSPTSQSSTRHAFSQALVLPSVPEDNQLAMLAQQLAYGPVPPEVRAIRSTQLNKLTESLIGLPTRDIALKPQNFPFIESTIQAAPVGYGVVKISNIPFGATRAEIIAFLGRNSKILNDTQEPVHIIMERVSSKTQDCYVEFMTTQDAVRAVERHRENVQKGRPSRLGERPVEVSLSSQAALMKDLFPLASGVWWDNAKPVIQAPIDGQPWKTFKGFVTEEEMTMLVKHVEIPQRSPYSKECPQRPYECMISTIKKLPWYMGDRITLRQRHAIYEATMKLITLLKQALQRDNRGPHAEPVINVQLMKRLVTAAMLCPGFSVVQKDNIAANAEMDQERARMFNQPRFADQWVHLHGICPKPGIPLDVLEWYIAIIREETTRYIHRKHILERNEIQRTSCYTSLYLGYIWYEIGLPTGKELENLSLHEVARRELAVIERALARALPLALSAEELELN